MEEGNQDVAVKTRGKDGFHWTCTNLNCRFTLNGGWQNYCSQCGTEFSAAHGRLVLSFITAISNPVAITKLKPESVEKIELPGLFYPSYTPLPWYDTSNSLKYYENLKTLYYYSNLEYAEGVDIGWYRTTHAIFPQNTSVLEIERLYNRFIISDGISLKGSLGHGIKDAMKAAIDAYKTYR